MTFIALGMSAVFPVAHVILSKGLTVARAEAGVGWIAGGGAWYVELDSLD
jgi:predicted membrane channel-forming protein YqfA (hemolysin III family)